VVGKSVTLDVSGRMMISGLFKLAFVKRAAEENNKNDANDALKLHAQIDTPHSVDEVTESTAKFSTPLENVDQLSSAVHDLLISKHLELSKVQPFFWSMVEDYIDRFQSYPFDVVKALFYYLEATDYPADEIRELVKKLEDCYVQQHGESMHKSTKLVCAVDGLAEEMKELRESIKYASLVGELEEA
jgi:hypothetical protein